MGRRAIVLLVALILAGLAAWAVWNYLQNVEDTIREDQAIVTVFRAGSNIAEGSDGSVLFSDFGGNGLLIVRGQDQAGDIPVDAITTEEELNQILTGRVAAGPISEGSILTESQWVTISVDVTPLAELIPSGKQAMTISVDSVRGVNGFVEAGDSINMIITVDIEFDKIPEEFTGVTLDPGTEAPPEGEQGAPTESVVVTYTRFVMQDIPVMAAGRDIRPDEEAPPTVDVGPETPAEGDAAPAEDLGNATVFTIEVTPEQAERIVFAFENGSIYITLVPEDFVEVETQGVIIDNLFGGDLVQDIFGTS
jgi:pilus assembly protein CpaB